MPYPDTNNAVEELALLPDWAAGVMVSFNYRTTTIPTLGGFDQIVRHQSRCRYGQTYERTTAGAEDNEKLSFERLATARKPVRIPLWSHGTKIGAPQPDINTATTEIGVPKMIEVGSRVILYTPEDGVRWKTVATITDERRTLTFEPDAGAPTYPAGAWVFPTEVGTFEIAGGWRRVEQQTTSREQITHLAT